MVNGNTTTIILKRVEDPNSYFHTLPIKYVCITGTGSKQSEIYECNWSESRKPTMTCSEVCPSSDDLFEHVSQEHVSRGPKGFFCKWSECVTRRSVVFITLESLQVLWLVNFPIYVPNTSEENEAMPFSMNYKSAHWYPSRWINLRNRQPHSFGDFSDIIHIMDFSNIVFTSGIWILINLVR